MATVAIYLRALIAFKLAGAALLGGAYGLLTGQVETAFLWFVCCGAAGAFISPNAFDLQDLIRRFKESQE